MILENLLYVIFGKVNLCLEELVVVFNKGLVEIKVNGIFDKLLVDYGIK